MIPISDTFKTRLKSDKKIMNFLIKPLQECQFLLIDRAQKELMSSLRGQFELYHNDQIRCNCCDNLKKSNKG